MNHNFSDNSHRDLSSTCVDDSSNSGQNTIRIDLTEDDHDDSESFSVIVTKTPSSSNTASTSTTSNSRKSARLNKTRSQVSPDIKVPTNTKRSISSLFKQVEKRARLTSIDSKDSNNSIENNQEENSSTISQQSTTTNKTSKIEKQINSNTMSSSTTKETKVVCPICSMDLSSFPNFQQTNHVMKCLGEEPLSPPPITEQTEIFSRHPFAVLCPFPDCGRISEPADFFLHAARAHAKVARRHQRRLRCPLCEMNGLDGNQWHQSMDVDVMRQLRESKGGESDDEDRPVLKSKKMSLLTHMRLCHSDLKGRGDPNNFHAVLSPEARRNAAAAQHTSVSTSVTASTLQLDNSEDSGEHSQCVVCEAMYDACACYTGPGFIKRGAVNPVVQAAQSYVDEQLTVDLSTECIICFEPFLAGEIVTRLGCLCVYHKPCLDSWYETGRQENGCPLHKD